MISPTSKNQFRGVYLAVHGTVWKVYSFTYVRLKNILSLHNKVRINVYKVVTVSGSFMKMVNIFGKKRREIFQVRRLTPFKDGDFFSDVTTKLEERFYPLNLIFQRNGKSYQRSDCLVRRGSSTFFPNSDLSIAQSLAVNEQK